MGPLIDRLRPMRLDHGRQDPFVPHELLSTWRQHKPPQNFLMLPMGTLHGFGWSGRRQVSLAVTAVLLAVVHPFIRLALALRLGNATATVTMMRMVASILAVAFWNGFAASVRHVSLLLLAAIVVVPSGHGSPLCSMRHRRICRYERSDGSSSVLRPLVRS
jgi:hypothetical protein